MTNVTAALHEQCQVVLQRLEHVPPDNEDYNALEDAMDINYTVNARGEYLGASILVAFGGANIWVDTRYDRIDGYWGGEHVWLGYNDAHDLHGQCEDLYECIRGS